MLIRTEYQITVTRLHDGVALRFAKDATLIASLKAHFPKARWGAGTRSWHIPGKLAYNRATVWAAEQEAYLAELEGTARDAEWQGLPATPTEAGRAALAAMKPFNAIKLQIVGAEIHLRTAYHPQMVSFCRGLGGRWKNDCWRLPLAAGVSIADHREDIRLWHNATVDERRRR